MCVWIVFYSHFYKIPFRRCIFMNKKIIITINFEKDMDIQFPNPVMVWCLRIQVAVFHNNQLDRWFQVEAALICHRDQCIRLEVNRKDKHQIDHRRRAEAFLVNQCNQQAFKFSHKHQTDQAAANLQIKCRIGHCHQAECNRKVAILNHKSRIDQAVAIYRIHRQLDQHRHLQRVRVDLQLHNRYKMN